EAARLQEKHAAELARVGPSTSVDLGREAADLSTTMLCDRVLDAVSRASTVDAALWLAKTRVPKLVIIRKVAMWMLRKHTKLSYPELGRYLDRDHTTIVYAFKTINDLRLIDVEVSRLIERAEAILAGMPEPE